VFQQKDRGAAHRRECHESATNLVLGLLVALGRDEILSALHPLLLLAPPFYSRLLVSSPALFPLHPRLHTDRALLLLARLLAPVRLRGRSFAVPEGNALAKVAERGWKRLELLVVVDVEVRRGMDGLGNGVEEVAVASG
jgi:hypothetical protein